MSAAQLQAQYAAVISKYNLTAVDFDIEGRAVTDTAANARRAAAITSLQRTYPNLAVSFTLEGGRSGIADDEYELLRSAIAAGVRVSRVNVMAMYFDANGEPMINLVKNTAERSAQQLTVLFPGLAPDRARALLGITPLIGRNQVLDEKFTYADAVALKVWARAQGIGMLSMWSLDRDQHCDSLSEYEPSRCSGLSQDTFDYASAFAS